MQQQASTDEDEVITDITVDGVRLQVIARWMCDGQWELCIATEKDGNTHWLEWFESPRSAIAAGLAAIEAEGVQSFLQSTSAQELARIDWVMTDKGGEPIGQPGRGSPYLALEDDLASSVAPRGRGKAH